MVLDNVTNDARLIEIATAALCADIFFHRDRHGRNVVAIPGWPNNSIAEAKRHDVLHHFFTQVVIDTINFLFLKQRVDMCRELRSRVVVMAKRLLDDQTKRCNFSVRTNIILDQLIEHTEAIPWLAYNSSEYASRPFQTRTVEATSRTADCHACCHLQMKDTMYKRCADKSVIRNRIYYLDARLPSSSPALISSFKRS